MILKRISRNRILHHFICLLSMIQSNSECPNACSAHGRCAAFDMCICYPNYMAADCSERMCQFGLAFIDTPKGDLDSSDKITGVGVVVAKNSQLYPYGTTEEYANMVDSSGNILRNTGHEYVECSSKGTCDRATGLCQCVLGFSGAACQYMSCPVTATGLCSGHGVCLSASQMAAKDADNIYNLWDKDINFGCLCDPGYYGADCNYKLCKVGFDPNYIDSESSFRFSNWTFAIISKSLIANIIGNYSIRFFDYSGKDWLTVPISYGAVCSTIVKSLETLPNNVIPANSVRCLQFKNFSKIAAADEPALARGNSYHGMKYTLAFPGNPGKLKQIEIEPFLDGSRPTLFDSHPTAAAPLTEVVYPNGFSGENIEYFTEKCLNVDVTLKAATYYDYLSGLTDLEFRLLSRCLGDADGYANTYSISSRVQGRDYKWDYGSKFNPHLVRLVDRTQTPITDLCAPTKADYIFNTTLTGAKTKKHMCSNISPAGFYVALYYDSILKIFKILTRPATDYGTATTFSIFTTTGVASMVSIYSRVFTDINRPYSRTVYTTNSTHNFTSYTGNIDCITNPPSHNGARECLEKGDKVFFLDPGLNKNSIVTNPKYLNLYTVAKIYKNALNNVDKSYGGAIVLDMSINGAWLAKNSMTNNRTVIDEARAYLFTPPINGYTYASECSNRGICSTVTGLCTCFTGYKGDSCQQIYNVKIS